MRHAVLSKRCDDGHDDSIVFCVLLLAHHNNGAARRGRAAARKPTAASLPSTKKKQHAHLHRVLIMAADECTVRKGHAVRTDTGRTSRDDACIFLAVLNVCLLFSLSQSSRPTSTQNTQHTHGRRGCVRASKRVGRHRWTSTANAQSDTRSTSTMQIGVIRAL